MKSEIQRAIERARHIAVLTHINPDGDAIGSSIALSGALRQAGCDAKSVFLEKIPHKYDFEDISSPYLLYDDETDGFDCVICVDCADKKRLGGAAALLSQADCTLNIDHHLTNTNYADINLIEDKAACGEIIFELLEFLGIELDKKTASCLYVAITTDTGNFCFESTNDKTFEKAAALYRAGADISSLAERVFSARTYESTVLIEQIISNMRLYFDGRMAVTFISLAEMADIGVAASDCETVINFARDIDSVELAVFIREMREGAYKVSFRSKKTIDVAELAGTFGGGGHKRAAGCAIHGCFEEVYDTVLSAVKGYFA